MHVHGNTPIRAVRVKSCAYTSLPQSPGKRRSRSVAAANAKPLQSLFCCHCYNGSKLHTATFHQESQVGTLVPDGYTRCAVSDCSPAGYNRSHKWASSATKWHAQPTAHQPNVFAQVLLAFELEGAGNTARQVSCSVPVPARLCVMYQLITAHSDITQRHHTATSHSDITQRLSIPGGSADTVDKLVPQTSDVHSRQARQKAVKRAARSLQRRSDSEACCVQRSAMRTVNHDVRTV